MRSDHDYYIQASIRFFDGECHDVVRKFACQRIDGIQSFHRTTHLSYVPVATDRFIVMNMAKRKFG